jgi:hypothetical protein
MMRPVQQEVQPPLRGAAGNHNRRPMRTITTDRLTIPGGELLRPAEISHEPILGVFSAPRPLNGYYQPRAAHPR